MSGKSQEKAIREKAILVGAQLRKAERAQTGLWEFSLEESLEELAVLAESAGAQVVGRLVQVRDQADKATLVGAGKIGEIRATATAAEASIVLFDGELTPTQQRNLEHELGTKVLDRTQLILDVFAARARTREGQLQVELAQLNYMLPRLAGRGSMMSRLGGGIGTRGPGETQLETDRRKIGRRISLIKQNLEKVRSGRAIQRKQRQNVPLLTVALVGYTNAGKSSLFNRLTQAEVLADAKMFATLDPTVRHLVLPSRRKILFSDTVGFIRRLPTTLVSAFRATLEEVVEAGLLLHVVDASSPHAAAYIEHVQSVLAEIGAQHTQQILVLNKCDLLPPDEDRLIALRRILKDPDGKAAHAVSVSARTGEGIDRLLELIDQVLPADPVERIRLELAAEDGATLHLLHEYGRVLRQEFRDAVCELEVDAPLSLRRQLKSFELIS
ncbi:MAG: GTPase HflX [Bryobacter sp.]|nr:GTPase HflX [Bryobacter sp.]